LPINHILSLHIPTAKSNITKCYHPPNSPHDLVLLLLLLLLPHEDILDLHPLVGREVRQVGHFVHGSGLWMSFRGIVVLIGVR